MVPWLAQQTGAAVMSFGPVDQSNPTQMRDGDQRSPDVLLYDGMEVCVAGLQITVHHTPGHMAGHLCFGYGDILFSGDHVMGWSTSMVSPPEGNMGDYRRSLHKLLVGDWRLFLAGHGAPILNPMARVQELITHRATREAMILAVLQEQGGTAIEIATKVYTDTPPALMPAAARNVLAHLIDLTHRNMVQPRGEIGPETWFERI